MYLPSEEFAVYYLYVVTGIACLVALKWSDNYDIIFSTFKMYSTLLCSGCKHFAVVFQ